MAGLSALKNELFNGRLQRTGVRVFPGTSSPLERLRAGGVPVVLATSSRNARAVLARAGLTDMFDLIVDGDTAAALHLPGKPDPALFLEAARAIGVPAARAAVIEDAVAWVQAARAGKFGLVVGIDRADQRVLLEAAGADVVLNDVSEFDIGLVLTRAWLLVYEGVDPGHEGHREALTTLGNGYMAVRGAAPECAADAVHYPGTYLAGLYNRLTSIIHGQETEDEHMVNVTNWLSVDVAVGDGRWWGQGGLKLRSERRELDLRRAVPTRNVLLETGEGRLLDVVQRRFVSAANPHVAALETSLTPRGWNGPARIRVGLDAGVINANVASDALLAHEHFRTVAFGTSKDGIDSVEVETSQSHIRCATAVRIRGSDQPLPGPATMRANRVFRDTALELHDGVPTVISKTVAVATSRDKAISSPLSGALQVLRRVPESFDQLREAHEAAWHSLVSLFVLELDADRQTQLILNLHVFHLLQTLTPHTCELDAGVPARGLHGEGCRGHVFWDELFVLPVVTSRLPGVTRALLDYRWRRLDAARAAAREAGLRGAMFPWQSGSDGREETPLWKFNPLLGDWTADHSGFQRHSGLAVAHNVWQYFEATGDHAWLVQHGAEILLEVARLFDSMASYDPGPDRYHILGVMGPDEYHTGYPDRPAEGVDDNAYTNVMAAWLCGKAVYLMRSVIQGHEQRELTQRLGITPGELVRWEQLSRRVYVPFHGEGIISQFEGYDRLEEFDWEHYRKTYGNIERLDLILEAEGDSTNRYMLAKQADALMLLYLLGEEQLIGFMRGLGYPVSSSQLSRTVDFYLARTAHGSTLSRVAHASVLGSMDPERAWTTFREALDADLDDTQGGTTRAGTHLGAMAGSIDAVQRTFAGLRMAQDELIFAPRMPAGLRRIRFTIRYREQLLDIALDHGRLKVSAAAGPGSPIRIRMGPETVQLHAGHSHSFLVRPSL